jgi:hypothetical protein
VTAKPDGGLVRADGHRLYPVARRHPGELVDEASPLA